MVNRKDFRPSNNRGSSISAKDRETIQNSKHVHIETRLQNSKGGVDSNKVTVEDSNYLESKRFLGRDTKPLFMSKTEYETKKKTADKIVNNYNKKYKR